MESTNRLHVYSASAGSGKTYTLARNVIDILIERPQNYKNILAVTFTNKATAEMKERIVNDLALMAGIVKPTSESEQDSMEQKLNDQIRMRQAANQPVSREDVQKRCAEALRLILSDYSHFNISTIDSFVQGVIRAFAYDQNLPANYGVEIDNEDMLDCALDNVMENLSNNDILKKWVVDYVKELIRDNKKTSQIEKSIRSLGRDLLTDKWSTISKHVPDSIEKVRELKKSVDETLANHYQQVCDAFIRLHDSGLNIQNIDGAKRKSFKKNLADNFDKNRKDAQGDRRKTAQWATEIIRVTDISLQPEQFLKKSGTPADALHISAMLDELRAVIPQALTCKAVLKKIVALGVTMELDNQIKDVQKDTNKISIGTTGDLLKKLIDDCPIPFIYEKIGSRYDYLMIDEFQDTSRVQYENFKPLLQNSLANGNRCLIVGDVKQSIYRFRDGDWKMLHKDLSQDFERDFQKDTLRTNHRSLWNIVQFNNLFYDAQYGLPNAIKNEDKLGELSNTIEEIYEDSQQTANKKEDNPRGAGIVSVRIFETQKDANYNQNEKTEAAHETIMAEYLGVVRTLKEEKNFSNSDICFLVRDKKEGSKIVNALAAAGEPVISEDSLFVLNAPSTHAILCMMRYIAYTDPVAIFDAACVILGEERTTSQIMTNWENGDLLREDLANRLTQLRGLGLPELFGKLQDMLPDNLQRRDHPFIIAMADNLRKFVQDGNVHLSDFIDYAQKNESKWSIETPQSKDAIRVMTIHKSKGLQFAAVLIPAFDWQLQKAQDIWCDMADSNVECAQPYILPISTDNSLDNSDISGHYAEETLMQLVDNLNTAYVATTRPEMALYIWGTYAIPQKESESIGTLSRYVLNVLDGEMDREEEVSPDTLIPLTVHTLNKFNGDVVMPNKKETLPTEDVAENKNAEWIELTKDWTIPKHQYVADRINIEKDSEQEELKKDAIVREGLTMHSILENVISTADIDEAVTAVEARGDLTADEAAEARQTLHHRLAQPSVKSWFDGSPTEVWNERAILDDAGNVFRPDRVMLTQENEIVILDYKFGIENITHKDQVANYHKIISHVWADRNVKSYLFYINLNKLEPVLETEPRV